MGKGESYLGAYNRVHLNVNYMPTVAIVTRNCEYCYYIIFFNTEGSFKIGWCEAQSVHSIIPDHREVVEHILDHWTAGDGRSVRLLAGSGCGQTVTGAIQEKSV